MKNRRKKWEKIWGGKGEEKADSCFWSCQSSTTKKALIQAKVPLGIHGFPFLWRTRPILCLLSTVNLLFIH